MTNIFQFEPLWIRVYLDLNTLQALFDNCSKFLPNMGGEQERAAVVTYGQKARGLTLKVISTMCSIKSILSKGSIFPICCPASDRSRLDDSNASSLVSRKDVA